MNIVINTAGIFKTTYGANRREVYNRHTTANQTAESDVESQNVPQGSTRTSSSISSTTSSASESKGSNSSEENNIPEVKSAYEQNV